MNRARFTRLGRFGLTGLRWFAGVLYVLSGLGGLVAVPFMIADGNQGWVYMIGGAPVIVAVGFVVHPWGLQRAVRGQPLIPPGLKDAVREALPTWNRTRPPKQG